MIPSVTANDTKQIWLADLDEVAELKRDYFYYYETTAGAVETCLVVPRLYDYIAKKQAEKSNANTK